MGCSSPFKFVWPNTYPNPYAEASVCNIKGNVQSGVTNTGACVKVSFNSLNARSHLEVHLKGGTGPFTTEI